MSFQGKLHLIRIILMIGLILVVFSSLFPLLERIKIISDKYIEGMNTLSKIDKKIEMRVSKENDLEKARIDFSKIDKASLSAEQEKIAEFISSIEGLAQKTNVSFKIKSAVSPADNKPYFAFQVLLGGSFSDILHFIAALSDNPEGFYRLIEIRRVVMQNTGDGTGTQLEGSLEIRVYSKN